MTLRLWGRRSGKARRYGAMGRIWEEGSEVLAARIWFDSPRWMVSYEREYALQRAPSDLHDDDDETMHRYPGPHLTTLTNFYNGDGCFL